VLAHVAEADKADVDLAVKAARDAFDHGKWPRMSGYVSTPNPKFSEMSARDFKPNPKFINSIQKPNERKGTYNSV